MQKLRKKSSYLIKTIKNFIKQDPIKAFYILFFSLIIIIIINNFLGKKKEVVTQIEAPKKTVKYYTIGSAPKSSFSARVEKLGVVTVMAQTSGIVQTIYIEEGQIVNRGNWLIGLSSNYQGGNALTLQRQIAQKQLEQVEQSAVIQKDIITKQKDLANKTNDNSEELRKITQQSIDETKNIININNDILSILDSNLRQYEATHSATSNNAANILSTKQLKSQYQTAVNSLNSALRNSEYSTNTDKSLAQIPGVQKDILFKQLELQEKTIEIGKEISQLQLRLAQVNEGLMFPSAPFSGKIERIFVRVGQQVNSGTPLVLISGADGSSQLVVAVPEIVAKKISQIEPSIVRLGNNNLEIFPGFISGEPTQGQLFSVIYHLSPEVANSLANNSIVVVDIPIGVVDTSATVPFVPLDSVFQTETQAYVFKEVEMQVVSQPIILGNVYGSFVEVISGLNRSDRIILDRSVVAGDKLSE